MNRGGAQNENPAEGGVGGMPKSKQIESRRTQPTPASCAALLILLPRVDSVHASIVGRLASLVNSALGSFAHAAMPGRPRCPLPCLLSLREALLAMQMDPCFAVGEASRPHPHQRDRSSLPCAERCESAVFVDPLHMKQLRTLRSLLAPSQQT